MVVTSIAWTIGLLLGSGMTQANPQGADAAGVISAAHLSADLTAEPGMVEVRYTLQSLPASRILGVHVLPVDGIELEEVEVALDGEIRGVVGFATSPTGLLRSGVALGPPTEQASPVELSVRYELPTLAADGGIVVPIVVAGQGAGEARPDFFRAEVRLPEGSRVTNAFPSGYEVTADSAGVLYAASLSVLPAFLRIDVRSGAGLRVGWVRLAEWTVLLLLGGLGVIGWRFFLRDLGFAGET